MPILPLDHPEPFSATLGVMLYPATDEADTLKARAFAAQVLAKALRRFKEEGGDPPFEILGPIYLDAGEWLDDLEERWWGGRAAGEVFKTLFALANTDPPLASWKHAIRIVEETDASITRAPRGLLARITWRATGDLKPFPNNPRRHPESQIAGLMKSIDLVWTNPILIDESATILAGHCRLEAAKRLGMADVPTITIAGLSDSEKRAIVIADNRLPERAVWDFDLLREHFRNLIEVDFEVELSGFTTGEIDLVIDGKPVPITANDPADDLTGFTLDRPAVSQAGDIWELGRHRLMCGDARRSDDYERLLRGDFAQMVVTDPPYNVRIQGHAMGRGKARHREFAMASGEMSEAVAEPPRKSLRHRRHRAYCA
jgi:hypothetical protein